MRVFDMINSPYKFFIQSTTHKLTVYDSIFLIEFCCQTSHVFDQQYILKVDIHFVCTGFPHF